MAESYGWAGKLLRVNLTTGEITTEDDTQYHKYIGGMGMAYRIMYEEAPMELDPYDEKALVIFGVGPLTGSGVLDGCGAPWWAAQRARTLANGRPYLLHFENVTHLRVCGVQLRNSPAWTVHPLNCVDVLIEDVSICNPYNSPNTDGINPESCRDVRILNCRVDVGDDCITLKSGTEETPSPAPCENIVIANCLLVHGHGGIVIGSEMSGGVRNVTVTNCVFTGTDRGLRVKTRRRRGGCVENLRLSNLVMERVFCPFVFNMYYSCGTAEKDRWVWEKTPYPVDGGTPAFRNIRINGVTVVGATASAGFFYGLAESPIDGLSLTDCHIEMARGAAPEKPAMMGNLEPMSARVLPAQREKRGISQRDAKKCRRRSLRHRRERRRRVLTGEKNETVR